MTTKFKIFDLHTEQIFFETCFIKAELGVPIFAFFKMKKLN